MRVSGVSQADFVSKPRPQFGGRGDIRFALMVAAALGLPAGFLGANWLMDEGAKGDRREAQAEKTQPAPKGDRLGPSLPDYEGLQAIVIAPEPKLATRPIKRYLEPRATIEELARMARPVINALACDEDGLEKPKQFLRKEIEAYLAPRTARVFAVGEKRAHELTRKERETLKVTPQQLANNAWIQVSAVGTAFMCRTTGLMVSNYHVIEESLAQKGRIEITLNGKTYKAQLVAHSKELDLAAIQLLGLQPEERFPVIPLFNDSEEIHDGWVTSTMGHAFDNGLRLTVGEYLRKRSKVALGVGPNLMEALGMVVDPGNSGGAAVGAFWNAYGVITATRVPKKGGVREGYIVPANTVADFLHAAADKLRQAPDSSQAVSIDALRLNTVHQRVRVGTVTMGERVTSVLTGSPAHRAGLRPGDTITRLNGARVHRYTLDELLSLRAEGIPVQLTILRPVKVPAAGGAMAIKNQVLNLVVMP